MNYDGVKLVCFDGKPHWLMSDGSFVPVRPRNNELYVPGALYLKNKDKSRHAACLIAGEGVR